MAARKKKMSKREQLLARHVAIRLLASMAEDDEVIEALVKQYNIQDALAKRIVVSAWDEIISADDGMVTSQKKGLLLMATREHYRRCLEAKDLAQGTASLRLLARLFGVDKSDPTSIDPSQPAKDEFAGRSPADLRFYAQNGHFPEEARAPQAKKSTKTEDPLSGLH
jgi:hypothetical protein